MRSQGEKLRWERVEEKLTTHPYLQDRFASLRPWIANVQMEEVLSSLGPAARLALGIRLATIGIRREESVTGWVGGELAKLFAVVQNGTESLVPNLLPEQRVLLEGLIEGICLLSSYFALLCLRQNREWLLPFPEKEREESHQLYEVTSLLFVASLGLARPLFTQLGKAWKWKEATSRQVGWFVEMATTLYMGWILAEKNPKELEEVILWTQPFFAPFLEEGKEIWNAIEIPELAKNWIGPVETLRIAWQRKEGEPCILLLQELVGELGMRSDLLTRDLEELGSLFHHLALHLGYGISRKGELSTQIVHSA